MLRYSTDISPKGKVDKKAKPLKSPLYVCFVDLKKHMTVYSNKLFYISFLG